MKSGYLSRQNFASYSFFLVHNIATHTTRITAKYVDETINISMASWLRYAVGPHGARSSSSTGHEEVITAPAQLKSHLCTDKTR